MNKQKIFFDEMKSHDKEVYLNFDEDFSEGKTQKFDEKKQ